MPDDYASLVSPPVVGNANSTLLPSQCDAGEWMDEDEHLCRATTTCRAGEWESRAPAPTSDRTCSTVRTCSDASSMWETAAPTSTTDRQCARLTVCGVDEWQTVAPTATSDRQCAKLTTCGSDEWTTAQATRVTDRKCAKVTRCERDEWQAAAPTTFSDRECRKLTQCRPDSEWESVPPTETSDRRCTGGPRPADKAYYKRCAPLLPLFSATRAGGALRHTLLARADVAKHCGADGVRWRARPVRPRPARRARPRRRQTTLHVQDVRRRRRHDSEGSVHGRHSVR